MRKSVTSIAVVASMLFASTAAVAANRPHAAHFTQVVDGGEGAGLGGKSSAFSILTGLLGIAAAVAIATALGGNSPNR